MSEVSIITKVLAAPLRNPMKIVIGGCCQSNPNTPCSQMILLMDLNAKIPGEVIVDAGGETQISFEIKILLLPLVEEDLELVALPHALSGPYPLDLYVFWL